MEQHDPASQDSRGAGEHLSSSFSPGQNQPNLRWGSSIPLSNIPSQSAGQTPYRDPSRPATETELQPNPDLQEDSNTSRQIPVPRRSQKKWMPYTMKLPFLLFLWVYTVLLIIVLELMMRNQEARGTLFFSSLDDGSFTGFQNFVYRYAFTLVSIIYGILLAMLDLDIKRLEPFYQLSQQHGASGRSSLSLSYPADYLPFIPLKALRRKHWLVFLAGTSVLLVFWGITPLISATLMTDTANQVVEREFELQYLAPPVYDEKNVTEIAGILPAIYAQTYLQNYAQLPYSFNNALTIRPYNIVKKINETASQKQGWSAKTTIYYNNITCSPAHISPLESWDIPNKGPSVPDYTEKALQNSQGPYRIQSDEFDCVLIGYFSYDTSKNLSVYNSTSSTTIGYEDGINKPFGMLYVNNTCGPNNFDYFYSSFTPANATSSPTVIMCREILYQALATTVLMQPSFLQTVSGLDDPERVIYGDGYNLESPKRLLYGDGSEAIDPLLDRYRRTLLSGKVLLGNPSITVPPIIQQLRAPFTSITGNDNFVPQFFYSMEPDTNKWGDASLLANMTVTVRRRMFTNFFQRQVSNGLYDGRNDLLGYYATMPGQQLIPADAIKVVILPVRIAQGLLSLNLAILSLVLYFSLKRDYLLFSDPGSLTSLASIIFSSTALKSRFGNTEDASEEELRQHLDSSIFRLGYWPNSAYRLDFVGPAGRPPSQGTGGIFKRLCGCMLRKRPPKKTSKVLNRRYGIIAVIGFSLILALMIGLKCFDYKYGGLLSLSRSDTVQQIIYVYLATSLATFNEPFWTLLMRRYAIWDTFRIASFRHGHPSDTISSTRTYKPMLVLIYQGILHLGSKLTGKLDSTRKGSPLLFTIALMALLSNVLAIACGALFKAQPTQNINFLNFHHVYESTFSSLPRVWSGNYNNATTNPFYDYPLLNQDQLSKPGSDISQDDAAIWFWLLFIQGQIPKAPWAWSEIYWPNQYFFPFDLPSRGVPKGQNNFWSANTTVWHAEPGCLDQKLLGPFSTTNGTLKVNFEAPYQKQVPNPPGPWLEGEEFNCTSYFEYDPVSDSNESSIVFMPSFRAPAVVNPAGPQNWTASQISQDNKCQSLVSLVIGQYNGSEISFDYTVCQPVLGAAPCRVHVDPEGQILSRDLLSTLTSVTGDSPPFTDTIRPEDFFATFRRAISYITLGSLKNVTPLTTTGTITTESSESWLHTLLYFYAQGDPVSSDVQHIILVLFPLFMSLNRDILFRRANPATQPPISGYINFDDSRYTMNNTMLGIVVVILLMYIVCTVWLYLLSSRPEIPKFPLSLAGSISYLYTSRGIFGDVANTELMSEKARHDAVLAKNATYGFGWFIGEDGIRHKGIEREELVQGLPVGSSWLLAFIDSLTQRLRKHVRT